MLLANNYLTFTLPYSTCTYLCSFFRPASPILPTNQQTNKLFLYTSSRRRQGFALVVALVGDFPLFYSSSCSPRPRLAVVAHINPFHLLLALLRLTRCSARLGVIFQIVSQWQQATATEIHVSATGQLPVSEQDGLSFPSILKISLRSRFCLIDSHFLFLHYSIFPPSLSLALSSTTGWRLLKLSRLLKWNLFLIFVLHRPSNFTT